MPASCTTFAQRATSDLRKAPKCSGVPATTSTPALPKRSRTSAEVKERFGKIGVEVVAGTPEHFSGFLKSEVARWAKVVREANIKAD